MYAHASRDNCDKTESKPPRWVMRARKAEENLDCGMWGLTHSRPLNVLKTERGNGPGKSREHKACRDEDAEGKLKCRIATKQRNISGHFL